jgi:hypothetical protein
MNPLVTAAVRTVFGCEPEQLNALFALTYAQAGGGFMRLTLTDPGCAQEKKIKVNYKFSFIKIEYFLLIIGWITTNIPITC